jgi:hypothetical protein
MFKRLSLVLIAALVALAGIGIAPAAPARAATSLADLMPADTAFYFEMRTADLDGSINKVLDIVRKADIPVPANIYENIDDQLSITLKREFSVAKDLFPLLGDSLAVGVAITDEMIADPSSQAGSQPGVLVALQIKDDAGFTKLFGELRELLQAQGIRLTSKETTYNGADATLYENRLVSVSILQAKGLLLVGTTQTVDDAIAAKSSLSKDAKFTKTINALPTNQFAKFWIGSRLYQYQAAQAAALLDNPNSTPMPGQDRALELTNNIYKIIDGIAMGVRNDGKNFAFDVVSALNIEEASKLDQIGELFTAFNTNVTPVTFKLASQIPNTALGVIYGTNLAQIYNGIKTQLTAYQNLMSSISPGLDTPEIVRGFEEFESGLKENLDIDWQADVLPWLGGEFAVYGVYNPTSDFALSSKNQWPFDSVLVIKSSDKAKTKAFVDKLESFAGAIGLKPAKVADGALSFNFPQSAFRLGVALVDDTFVVTSGTGLLAASDGINGKGILADSAVWKRASAPFGKDAASAYFLDLTQLNAVVTKIVGDNAPADTKILLRVLGQFESATLYSTNFKDGVTTGSAVITLK